MGIVLLRAEGQTIFEFAGGMADRAEGRPISPDTRFGTASGTKGFTALTVVALIEEGLLGFDSRLCDIVDGLPNVDPHQR